MPEAEEEWLEDGCLKFLYMRLASASANYTRPDQVISAFYRYLGSEEPFWPIRIHRLDVYAGKGTEADRRFVPLGDLGEDVL